MDKSKRSREIFDPSKEIIDPIFTEGDGIAICHKLQNYGANGWGDVALMMKSMDGDKALELRKSLRQVRVTLSFEEFLAKFFSIYHSDAIILAKILGFETSSSDPDTAESYGEWLEEKVSRAELLKSSSNPDEDFFNLDYKTQDLILDLQVKFEKGLLSGLFSEGVIVDNKATSDDGDKDVMSVEQSPEFLELKKAFDTLKEQNDKFIQEKELAEKATLIKCDDLPFVEDKEAFTSLMKSQSIEVISYVMEVMHKASSLINEKEKEIADIKKSLEENDVMFKAMGHSAEKKESGGVDEHQSKISNAIKSRSKK